jgi:hypothetical protein
MEHICNICQLNVRMMVVPACHFSHCLCSTCYNSLKQEICPFCRSVLVFDHIEDYAIKGPQDDTVTFIRGNTNNTDIDLFIKQQVPELVLSITAELPEGFRYKLDPLKTKLEVDGIGDINLLQYALMVSDDILFKDITIKYEYLRILVTARESLIYAMEYDLNPYELYSTYEVDPIIMQNEIQLVGIEALNELKLQERQTQLMNLIKTSSTIGVHVSEFKDLDPITDRALALLEECGVIVLDCNRLLKEKRSIVTECNRWYYKYIF